jgi:hypothetical protein
VTDELAPQDKPVAVVKKRGRPRKAHLPPPGHKRQETLKQRTDTLAEAAESQPIERERIDPKNFKIDREIAAKIVDGALEVSNAQPGYKYCWARFGKGQMDQVQAKRSIRVRDAEGTLYAVWEVVSGDMPESRENRNVEGLRVIGDTLLMRALEDRYAAVEAYEAELRRRQQEGVNNNLISKGERYGITVHTDVNSPVLQRAIKHATASNIANQQLGQHIREGTVPGMTIRR